MTNQVTSNGEVNLSDHERILSLIGGGALTLFGITRGKTWGTLLAIVGGELLSRGATGHCRVYGMTGLNTNRTQPSQSHQLSVPHERGQKVVKSITINRSADDLYNFWRNFENLARFMTHIERIEVQDGKRSHWVVKAPLGGHVEWDARIINEIPGKLIGWRSLENADVDNAGSVEFESLDNLRGTKVTVSIKYSPPGDKIGIAVAKLLGENPEKQIEEDLRRLKQLMETGEIATTHGQSTGRGIESGSQQPIMSSGEASAGAGSDNPPSWAGESQG